MILGALLALAGCNWELLEEGVSLPENGDERILLLEELEATTDEDAETESDVSGGDVSEGDVSGGDTETSEWDPDEDSGFLYKGGGYFYRQLSVSEKLWYRDMALALGTMKDKIKLSGEGIAAGLDEAVVDKIFQYILNDHPELFYVEGYSYTKYTRGEKTVAIEFAGTYNQDMETALARGQEIEKAVEEFIETMPAPQDDYDLIKYVYEKLIRDTDYDVNSEDNQNIYSVFVGHSSVCQGYSKAFQLIMNRMGVECVLVQGKVLETGEGHAWNLVKSNGEYYYVDATWGDISYQDADQNMPRISYDYLCITTDQLERTHVLNSDMDMPECKAETDNYFVRENALFVEYDKEQLADLINRRLEQEDYLIALRCESKDCYELMQDALLNRREVFDYLAGTGIRSFAYTVDDAQFTLTFFMMTSNG